MKLQDYICYSGGAKGSDTEWGNQGKVLGAKVYHFYSEDYPRTYSGNYALSGEDLKKADPFLMEVNNKFLHRHFPTSKGLVNDLLRRNYYQVKDSDGVFAVSSFDVYGIVLGGTAWAVYMGIIQGLPTYVFDQVPEQWFVWRKGDTPWDGVFVACDIPVLTRRYTGIGTRALDRGGIQAITDVYRKTCDGIV